MHAEFKMHCIPAVSSQSLPNNEWFEYDVGEEPVQHFSGDTAEAIQSLLDMQASESGQPRQKVSVQRYSINFEVLVSPVISSYKAYDLIYLIPL